MFNTRPFLVCILPLVDEMLPEVVVMVLASMSPDAVIPVISLNYIIFNTKRLVNIDTIKCIKSNEIGET